MDTITDNLFVMVSLAGQKVRDAAGLGSSNIQQNQPVGDESPINQAPAIKQEAEQNRSQRVDDAIELEQDAARLARNVIGVSHNIAAQQMGLSQSPQASALQAAQAQVQRAIPKDPVRDRRLNHFQHRQSPQDSGRARKRSLLGGPPKRVTMHRPTGAHTMPASVVVS